MDEVVGTDLDLETIGDEVVGTDLDLETIGDEVVGTDLRMLGNCTDSCKESTSVQVFSFR